MEKKSMTHSYAAEYLLESQKDVAGNRRYKWSTIYRAANNKEGQTIWKNVIIVGDNRESYCIAQQT